MRRRLPSMPSRIRSEPVSPPPPLRPEGMLSSDVLNGIKGRVDANLADISDVILLLPHVAACDRLLGMLEPAVRIAIAARANSFRAARHHDPLRGKVKTSMAEAIQHLAAIFDQPDGKLAKAAYGRLQAAALRQAALDLIMEGVPGSEPFRDWLKQRADKLDKEHRK